MLYPGPDLYPSQTTWPSYEEPVVVDTGGGGDAWSEITGRPYFRVPRAPVLPREEPRPRPGERLITLLRPAPLEPVRLSESILPQVLLPDWGTLAPVVPEVAPEPGTEGPDLVAADEELLFLLEMI